MTQTPRNDEGAPAARWHKPVLTRLGSLRDIAGPRGVASQSPTQLRS